MRMNKNKQQEKYMSDFTYQPSYYVPFRDTEVLERVRKIKREDIEKHSNPDFRIMVKKAHELGLTWPT